MAVRVINRVRSAAFLVWQVLQAPLTRERFSTPATFACRRRQSHERSVKGAGRLGFSTMPLKRRTQSIPQASS